MNIPQVVVHGKFGDTQFGRVARESHVFRVSSEVIVLLASDPDESVEPPAEVVPLLHEVRGVDDHHRLVSGFAEHFGDDHRILRERSPVKMSVS